MSQLFFCRANLLACFSEVSRSTLQRLKEISNAVQPVSSGSMPHFLLILIGVVAVSIGSVHRMVYQNVVMFVKVFQAMCYWKIVCVHGINLYHFLYFVMFLFICYHLLSSIMENIYA
jgi:hypothetical protein